MTDKTENEEGKKISYEEWRQRMNSAIAAIRDILKERELPYEYAERVLDVCKEELGFWCTF